MTSLHLARVISWFLSYNGTYQINTGFLRKLFFSERALNLLKFTEWPLNPACFSRNLVKLSSVHPRMDGPHSQRIWASGRRQVSADALRTHASPRALGHTEAANRAGTTSECIRVPPLRPPESQQATEGARKKFTENRGQPGVELLLFTLTDERVAECPLELASLLSALGIKNSAQSPATPP